MTSWRLQEYEQQKFDMDTEPEADEALPSVLVAVQAPTRLSDPSFSLPPQPNNSQRDAQRLLEQC